MNHTGSKDWLHLPRMATTRIPLWLCRCQGSLNLLGLKEALEIMVYTPRLPQRTPYRRRQPFSVYQGAKTRIRALSFPYQPEIRQQKHLKTGALHHEPQPVLNHRTLLVISPLLDSHLPQQFTPLFTPIAKAMHPLPRYHFRPMCTIQLTLRLSWPTHPYLIDVPALRPKVRTDSLWMMRLCQRLHYLSPVGLPPLPEGPVLGACSTCLG